MSIKIRFEQGPTVVQTTLKDEAMTELMKIVQSQAESVAAPNSPRLEDEKLTLQPPPAADRTAKVKEWLSKHTASEVLNLLEWDTFPDKILILGAFHEAKDPTIESWRSADSQQWFVEAREPAPTNFPRDIANAIREGIIGAVTARTYQVSRKGWTKMADGIATITKETVE